MHLGALLLNGLNARLVYSVVHKIVILSLFLPDCFTLSKAGFPLANFFARSEFFVCLYPISSRLFQLRDQRQMKNSLRAKKFASGKPA